MCWILATRPPLGQRLQRRQMFLEKLGGDPLYRRTGDHRPERTPADGGLARDQRAPAAHREAVRNVEIEEGVADGDRQPGGRLELRDRPMTGGGDEADADPLDEGGAEAEPPGAPSGVMTLRSPAPTP